MGKRGDKSCATMHQKNQVDVGFLLDSLCGSWQFSPQNHSKPLISVDVFFVFFIPGFPASRFKTTAGRTVVFWNWFRVWTLAENVSSSAWPYLMCSVNIPNLPLARLFCKRRCQACKINIPWCCSAGFVVPILSWRYGSLQKSARILFVGIPCLIFFKLGL